MVVTNSFVIITILSKIKVIKRLNGVGGGSDIYKTIYIIHPLLRAYNVIKLVSHCGALEQCMTVRATVVGSIPNHGNELFSFLYSGI